MEMVLLILDLMDNSEFLERMEIHILLANLQYKCNTYKK